MATKPKAKIEENALLKALTDLQDQVAKGDALEEQDPEGGLSTEGEPLSTAAPSGKGESTRKSRRSSSSRSSSSGDDDSSSVEKAEDDDDDSASSDGSSRKPFPPKKKMKKAAAESSSDGASSDDGSGDDESDSTEKSFKQVAEQDETMAKAIEISSFLEALVDQVSASMSQMRKSIVEGLQGIEQRLAARIDSRVAKSAAAQHEFNTRLAAGVAAIGNAVQDEVIDLVKSFANAPAQPRGRAVISKGEVNTPPWQGVQRDARMANGSDDGDYVAELRELSSEAIGDWLFKKSCNNAIDQRLIMAWENDRYNPETLPVQVRKALVNDLCK